MNEHLAGLYAYASPYHAGFAAALLALCALYLALTQLGVGGKGYVLRISYFLPIYHGALACAAMSGLVMLAALNYSLNFRTTAMIAALILLIATSAAGFKRLKRYARAGELAKFKKFALIKGAFDVFLIILASAL